jgi:hypothetical protein
MCIYIYMCVSIMNIISPYMSMTNISKYLCIYIYIHYTNNSVFEWGNFGAYIYQARNVWQSYDAHLPFLAKTGSYFHADLSLNGVQDSNWLFFHYITLHCITLHYITLHYSYITLDWSRLHYIRLRYIRLDQVAID